jgi:hypothetical protein
LKTFLLPKRSQSGVCMLMYYGDRFLHNLLMNYCLCTIFRFYREEGRKEGRDQCSGLKEGIQY